MNAFHMHKQMIAIVGPTASGKSDFAIAIAQKYNGEIISADSRQVYRDMDIGTGKVPRDPLPTDFFYSEGIRHHLLDIADPKDEYNISHFLYDARQAVEDIRSRNKLSILCGGTHFWIQTLLEDHTLPEVPPNPELRLQLSKKTNEELLALLENRDPDRARMIDPHNTIRLIRALEIVAALGKVPSAIRNQKSEIRHARILALNPQRELLRKRIAQRLDVRFSQGMVEEVKRLRTQGISWERLESFGLEYRYIAFFLQNKLSEKEMREQLFFEVWHYAKRQLTWLRRWEKQGTSIQWIENPEQFLKEVKF
jgi:tRNA dimethylallyltransferase